MNWDDLRVVAAIHEQGSFAGAAASLGLDQTTVARRLARLEIELGVSLFEAADGRRRATPSCEPILARIRDMERRASEIRGLAEGGPEITGRIRLAATDAVAEELLAPSLPDFLLRHPGLVIELMTSSGSIAFDRWEADLALRLNRPQKGNFDIRKLGELSQYLIEPKEEGRAVSCFYPEEYGHLPEAQLLETLRLPLQPRCITANIRVIKAMLASGRAVGIVPDFLLGDLRRDERLRLTLLPDRREAWLLIQSHLRREPAIRAAIAWLEECFRSTSRGPFSSRSDGEPSPPR